MVVKNLYAEVIDDQIDLVSRQFLGLTVSCARCHDHKFDPIPTADYYSLGGIFLSSRVLQTNSRIGAHRLKISLASEGDQRRRERILKQIAELKSAVESSPESDRADLQESIRRLQQQLPHEAGEAIGIQEGGYSNSRHKEIADMPIYIRGDPFRLGSVVPRRFPQVLTRSDQPLVSAVTAQSGRLELGKWIASPDNPLTARVMVNRLWHYHFGAGIVRTPSNFGQQGERPTHPELLDYLATQFVKSGWSIKDMHRLIMLSATYRQSASEKPETVNADPENRLAGSFRSRRLTAEEIYDSLLFVSGQLKSHTGEGGNRALYQRIGHEHTFLPAALFDAPATGTVVPSRDQSTTATQALYMMNDRTVVESAKRLAASLEKVAPAVAVEHAFLKLFGRSPDAAELAAGKAFFAMTSADRRWSFYQVLLCSNEFIHVD